VAKYSDSELLPFRDAFSPAFTNLLIDWPL
jgi:hypothetical protein